MVAWDIIASTYLSLPIIFSSSFCQRHTNSVFQNTNTGKQTDRQTGSRLRQMQEFKAFSNGYLHGKKAPERTKDFGTWISSRTIHVLHIPQQ